MTKRGKGHSFINSLSGKVARRELAYRATKSSACAGFAQCFAQDLPRQRRRRVDDLFPG